MAAALIQTRGVAKDYRIGGHVVVQALRDVSLDITAGEFVAIMGASGSGKSTLLNVLGCLDAPTSGRYFFEDRDVSELGWDDHAQIRNQRLGFVFQSFNLLPRMTAVENVALPLVYRRLPRVERHARALAVLAAVGLADRAQHYPSQLSGGQQQRVGIARALVTEPTVILADEPTGNLDVTTSVDILTLFQQLNRTRGITVVLVTHEPDIAAFATRTVVMRDGRIIEDRPAAPAIATSRLALPAGLA